ncbi:MAG TPA: BTAD domain-containing putative transcriptional regulator [Solirubrobacteraceae bacterium]|nr:BTAD domain-containing putative transcriptional regulator [Solirubrobacteraceae bacterium]
MPRGIVRAKLAVPTLPEERVDRPRLDRRLAELIERNPVVAVSATAGAGKTTAVASAIRHLDRPVAWLTLDRTDTAPGRLVTYLEEALAAIVPDVVGTATRALSVGVPHAEAAGILAEALRGAGGVLVLDEIERLGDAQPAWHVVESLLRYAPEKLHVVLISRRALPFEALPRPAAQAALGDADLAFTPEEAARALELHGESGQDETAVVEATGGWVTGVLFEAWRWAGDLAEAGGAVDPLHGYLSAHIVRALDAAEREFLETTSVLTYVTAPRAEALGIPDAAARLAGLRQARLPVTWSENGTTMRCHPRFREYLLTRLEERGEHDVAQLHHALGRRLAEEGYDEDAVDALLRAHAPEEALAPAERAIGGVIERFDVPIAERWLEQLTGVTPTSVPLTVAELMIAVGSEDFQRGAAIAERLEARGDRDAIVHESPLTGALMAWCNLTLGRPDEFHRLAASVPPGHEADVLRYVIGHLEPGPRPPRPAVTGSPLDALILGNDYYYGRFAELDTGHPFSDWIDAITGGPMRIGALRAIGQTQRALEMYEAAQASGRPGGMLEQTVRAELLLDAGRTEQAREAIAHLQELARGHDAPLLLMVLGITIAKVALRLDRDVEMARAVLDEADRLAEVCPYPFVTEQIDTWYGLALLLSGEDEAARDRLRRALTSMMAADRLLEMPTAAVYLAEAEWRTGDEGAADAAADVALDAAKRQGSNHIVLQALADFPFVASRRIDTEPGGESAWHELGRALMAQRATVGTPVRSSVELHEFGRSAIVVDGTPVRPRIAKTYELLAYLTTRPGLRAERAELLDALFDGRADPSTRAYLRQAIRWLREVLGSPDAVIAEDGEIRLGDTVSVAGESTRLEVMLAEAARLQGADRLDATLAALTIADQGEFLPDASTQWVEHRREALGSVITDARLDAAELAFAAGRYDDADHLAGQVLDAEPYREAAWRLRMRLADALGAGDSVIRAYHACERALAELGTTPSKTTRELLERLRR